MKIPGTREQADALLAELGRAQLARQKIEARMNEKIIKIKAEAEAEAAPWMRAEQAIEQALEKWFASARAELAKGKRSFKMTFGKIGARWIESVALIPGHWSWETAVIALKSRGLGFFIRQKEEVNKDAILAAGRDTEFEPCGLRIARGEVFFAKPDLDKVEKDGVEVPR